MTSLALARLLAAHAPVAALFPTLPPALERRLLAECGLVCADFMNGAAAPHAVLALVALRLVARRFYVYFAERDFPLLNALPRRWKPDEDDALHGHGTSNLAPWYRHRAVAAVVAGTLARPVVFGSGAYWASLADLDALDLLRAALAGRNAHVLAQGVHFRRALARRHHDFLMARVLAADLRAAFEVLHDIGQLRDAAGEWLLRDVCRAGALACYTCLHDKAVAAGTAHAFVRAARACVRGHAGPGAPPALEDVVNAQFAALQKERRRAQDQQRRAARKRARDADADAADAPRTKKARRGAVADSDSDSDAPSRSS